MCTHFIRTNQCLIFQVPKISNLQTNSEIASQIICKTIEKIGHSTPDSKAHTALKDGLMTPKDKVPLSTRKRINLFTEKYWGPL